MELAPLRQAIITHLKEALIPGGPPFGRMNVIELKPPNYPPDWTATWTDPGNFLESYKGIPALRRVDDLLVEEATGDRYWPSEYQTATGPTKFRCGFIVHLDRQRPSSTAVQVYEKVPEVWVGEHWALLHEGIGFGKVHDIRAVEPTVKDRLDLLNAVDQIASNR